MKQTEIRSFNERLESLRSERSDMIPWWIELSEYHLNHRGRFLNQTNNKNKRKRNTKVVNNTSRLAGRTLQGGLMAGITSPARPWFRLKIEDTDLMEQPDVKTWTSDVEKAMRRIFNSSNLYTSLLSAYLELGVFGTAVIAVYEDYDNVIRTEVFTVGQYMLGLNGKGGIDTFYREYHKSAGELVKEFGIDNVSNTVKNQWKNGKSEAQISVVHLVEPNDNRDNLSPLAKHKKFRSVYYEASESTGKVLRESGFDSFPYLTPRWEVVGGDTYANSCCGMDTLGDQKSLQLREKEIGTSHHYAVSPVIGVPSSTESKLPSGGMRPGQRIPMDDTTAGGKSVLIYAGGETTGMREDRAFAEERVKKGFYEDLFLMLSNSQRSQITAREINERHEEKLLMLGPVLERLHGELLDPLIERTFLIMDKAGILPPLPEALQNVDVAIEYVSVLAQAQKLTTLSELDMTMAFVGNVAGIYPEARHKFKPNEAIDAYAEAMGTPPRVIASDDEVEAKLQAEAEAEKQQLAMEQMGAVSESAKNMADIDTSGQNAMTDLLGGTLGAPNGT